jgi:protein-tyrosine-phosphatase
LVLDTVTGGQQQQEDAGDIFKRKSEEFYSEIKARPGDKDYAEKVKAYSSGSKPSGKINPKAIAAMGELGYDLTSHDSKSLDEIPQIEYEYAITMGCGDECPLVNAKHREDWQLPDPRHMEGAEFNKIRDEIKERVLELLARI